MASTTPQYVTQDTGGSDSDLQELAKRHLWMHFTRMSAYEDAEVPIITRGEGCHVYDEAGKRYFDGLAALFCVNAGHGRTEIGEAMAEQVKELGFFTNWSYAHPTAIKLAKRIADLAPGDLNRVFFTSGGSEAVESALKLCRLYHRKHGEAGRFKLIAREIAYHGTTMGALSATGIPDLRAPFEPMLPGNAHAANTNSYRWPEDRDPLWAAEQIEETILFEGPETVSAVILEPVQNAGGCFVPQEGYWQKVREICDKYGVLLISDEVICSWGRLGHYFGAQRFDYQPDLITTAKGLTSAYSPMGAVIASDKVAEVFMEGTNMFTHGITFGGHPVSAAAAMANLDIFENEDLCGRVRENEAEFRSQLESLRELPIVGDVRGAGYFYGIELVKNQDTKESFDDDESEWLLRGFLSGALYEQGLICRADDRGDPVIQLSPPLIAGPEEFEEVTGILRSVLTEAAQKLGEQVAEEPRQGRAMLTLRTLLDEMELALATGEEGAEAPVRWVHITELPDPTPWLSGGELILTTGLQLTTEELQREFVRRLSDHQLAGLGFGVGFKHQTLPEPLVEEAEQRGFPVFEVPYDLPFIAITEKAFARLVNEQYEVLQRGIAIHKRLERLVIEERGLDELVRALAAALGGTVTVIDAAGEAIAQRTFRRELPEGVLDTVREEVRSQQAAHEAGQTETTELAPEHPAIAGRSVVLPVYTRGRGAPRAWLFAARDTGGLGDFERLILQQATTVVALELMRQRAMHDTERRLAGDVLAEALTGRLAERELASRLRPFGVGEQAAVLVFATADPVAEAGPLDRFLHDGGHGALVAPREDLLCAVVDAPEGSDPIELAREARTALAGRGEPPRAAASRPDAVGALRRSFNEARIALEATAIANGSASDVASYRDMGASQLLLSLQDDAALALYCQSVLGPLENDSGEYGEELIRSLEAFIEQNGQWEKAARQLFCHRHTLRYRIRRVEELTGRDLGTARDRIEFWLALRGRELVP